MEGPAMVDKPKPRVHLLAPEHFAGTGKRIILFAAPLNRVRQNETHSHSTSAGVQPASSRVILRLIVRGKRLVQCLSFAMEMAGG
jgi:hypothetical protein